MRKNRKRNGKKGAAGATGSAQRETPALENAAALARAEQLPDVSQAVPPLPPDGAQLWALPLPNGAPAPLAVPEPGDLSSGGLSRDVLAAGGSPAQLDPWSGPLSVSMPSRHAARADEGAQARHEDEPAREDEAPPDGRPARSGGEAPAQADGAGGGLDIAERGGGDGDSLPDERGGGGDAPEPPAGDAPDGEDGVFWAPEDGAQDGGHSEPEPPQDAQSEEAAGIQDIPSEEATEIQSEEAAGGLPEPPADGGFPPRAGGGDGGDGVPPGGGGEKPRKKKRALRTVLLWLAAAFAAALIAGYFIFDVANWQTLDVAKITDVQQTGSVYDMDGGFVTAIRGSENRVVVPLSQVPKTVRDAFLAAEDLRFYRHFGFDPVRIAGAVLGNLRSGGYEQGASTITQQLVKLSHLSAEKTIARKLEEVCLAVQLERQFSKDEILEMYLNFIYFGRGAYGIQAASQAYFGVDVQDLSAAQGACLAAIIKAPSAYAPHLNPEANETRRAYILDTMLENGMLEEAAHAAAVAEEIAPIENTGEELRYGWFVDAVLDEAESLLDVSAEALLSGGYHIYTTLSPQYQDLADARYENSEFPADAADGTQVQSGMACLDVNSGAVRAIVGGRSYEVRRGLNRATHLRRQPGSALKPLAVYAPAIEYGGYMTASVLNDTPTTFHGSYRPRNSGNAYYGYVTLRTALSYSLNVAAVSLMDQIGVANARAYLERVGIPLDERDSNLALALGAMTYGVSPVQLAAAYAPFGNGGVYYAPYFIERIESADGRALYTHETQGARVLSAQSAYLMTSMLQTVTASGTGAKLSGAGTPVAGKTGTVNMTGGGNRDIWMAAYNPEISTAFWMGFDNPDAAHKLQGWVSGGDYTAAMAAAFFKAAYRDRDKPGFARPSGIVALEIDKKSIEWAGEAMLASSLTPKAYRYSEVFLASNQPTRQSNVWSAPRKPSNFYVTHNDAGNPVLVIVPQDTALYRIQRDAVGECIILGELSGTAGNTLYYTDKQAQPGVVYTYRIIPIHQELLNNGVLLEGPQAVQIAQARAAAGRTLWENLRGLFTGENLPAEPEENTVEETQSLFWE